MHVLIVGGGLGGLSLAQCLRKQNILFEVFESDDNEDSRFQGWAIGIHSIIDDLVAAFPSDMPDIRKATDHSQPLNLPAQICLYFPGKPGRYGIQDTSEKPIIRAERRRLRKWLSTNIPIQWGKCVTSIHYDDDHVEVLFSDGSRARGDILVGADGSNSVVRHKLTQRPAQEFLSTVPLATIIGEVTLHGDAFKRQLELGHSAYTYLDPRLGFGHFNCLHHVLPDGNSGKFYWMIMEPDDSVDEPTHWLKTASRWEKLSHTLKLTSKLPERFRQLFELTPALGIKADPHIWRDLRLNDAPNGRVVLLGDAAHAMTPFRGEGGYHTFLDAMNLSKLLVGLDGRNMAKLEAAMASYNAEMFKRVNGASRKRGNDGTPRECDKKSKMPFANQELRPLPEVSHCH